MTKRVKRLATLIIVLLLLALFTLPRAYLARVCKQMLASSTAAAQAAQLDGDPAPHLARLKELYEKSAPTLRLFLDHATVDAVGAAIATCAPLRDQDELLSTLSVLNAAIRHAQSIETLSAESIF